MLATVTDGPRFADHHTLSLPDSRSTSDTQHRKRGHGQHLREVAGRETLPSRSRNLRCAKLGQGTTLPSSRQPSPDTRRPSHLQRVGPAGETAAGIKDSSPPKWPSCSWVTATTSTASGCSPWASSVANRQAMPQSTKKQRLPLAGQVHAPLPPSAATERVTATSGTDPYDSIPRQPRTSRSPTYQPDEHAKTSVFEHGGRHSPGSPGEWRRRSSAPGRSRWTRSHLPPGSVLPRERHGRSLPRYGELIFGTPPRHRAPNRNLEGA
jgi:hypothetical protein